MAHAGMELADRYILRDRLGGGGMGEVWRGTDRKLDRLVAVKLMRELFSDPELAARFQLEARLAAKLQHPGIAVVHDVGSHAGQQFIVMELLHGRDLSAVLAKAPTGLLVPRAVSLTIQAAEALQAAHAAHVIHRDLKPANLFLLDGGQLKICDFGLAKAIDVSSHLTATGQVMGTPAYMSPEQCEGRPADERSDLYSLGCVLYALLVGRPPFPDGQPLAIMMQHLTKTPASPRAIRPAIPRDLDTLIMRLLAKSQADRPRGADQVATALRAIGDAAPADRSHPLVKPAPDRPRQAGPEAPGVLSPLRAEIARPGHARQATPQAMRGQQLPVGSPQAPINIRHPSSQKKVSPVAMVITPDGSTAYVASYSGEVFPVDLVDRRAGAPATVMDRAHDLAITPDGKTVYVIHGSPTKGTVTPINRSTNAPGKEITFGKVLDQIVITPDGATAYVVGGCDITPVDIARGKHGRPIRLDRICAKYIAVTPDGSTAYVIATVYQVTQSHIVSVDLATKKSRILTTLAYNTNGIKISPDGKSAYVIRHDAIVPISLPSGTVRAPIQIRSSEQTGPGLSVIAIAAGGSIAYVLDHDDKTLVPVGLGAGTRGTPVPFKYGPGFHYPSALAIAPDGATVYVLSSDGTITPISMRSGR